MIKEIRDFAVGIIVSVLILPFVALVALLAVAVACIALVIAAVAVPFAVSVAIIALCGKTFANKIRKKNNKIHIRNYTFNKAL
jgi:hypothetical protein